jgi:trimethylamine monooxygenase
MCAFNELKS